MKKIVALILALVMVFALCACGSKAEPADSNKLILGTSADYSPFEFMYPDDKGELQYAGIDVSVAQYIADHTAPGTAQQIITHPERHTGQRNQPDVLFFCHPQGIDLTQNAKDGQQAECIFPEDPANHNHCNISQKPQ